MPTNRHIAALCVVALVLLGGVAAGAATGVDDGVFAPSTQDGITVWQPLSHDLPADAVTPRGTPTWTVTVDDLDAVLDWANASDDRTIRYQDNATQTVSLEAPAGHVGATFIDDVLARGLAAKPYVEHIELNRRLELAHPVDPVNRSDWEAPVNSRVARWPGIGRLTQGDQPPLDGVAFADTTTETTLRDARKVINDTDTTAQGSGLTVAVIDTGLNTNDGQVFGNGSFGSDLRVHNDSKNFISNETYNGTDIDALEDGNGHGTWVASAIAANHSNWSYDGVAPNATVMALKALQDDGSGSIEDIRRAVLYAERHGADQIAMSLGSPVYSETLHRAMCTALDGNVTTITVAAGNSRQTMKWVASPSDTPCEGVIAVGASDTNQPGNASIAYFSQLGGDPGTTDTSLGVTRGEAIDVSAPGMKVTAAVPQATGSTRNVTHSGSSMAQPFVAGAHLVAMDADPSLVNDTTELVRRTRLGADPVPNASVPETGHGLLNVEHIVDDTTVEENQTEAMNTDAKARGAYYRGLAGGPVAVPFLSLAGLGAVAWIRRGGAS